MGVQLMAEPFREDLCFAAAEAIERQAGTVLAIDPA